MRRWEGRRSPRSVGYDYGQAGVYFVTVCTWGREAVLGEVVGGEVVLSAAGRAVEEAWETVPLRVAGVDADAFVVMPNPVHGIVVLGGDPEVPPETARPTLATVMRVFKSVSGIEGNRALGRGGQPFWQRSYHDRIVRNGRELEVIRRYIEENPGRWEMDVENPAGGAGDGGPS